MIEVQGLTKSYGDRLAISDLNFSVKKGEVVGFLGPNGAGKSTTMKILTGFMSPSHGLAKIAGFDVFEEPLEVKKRIGYLPEVPPVYAEMTVQEYLEFVARLKGVEAAKLKASVERSIEKTHLGEVRRRLIQHLSKGFRQRVGIAQALVSDPEVLILDEPTVGLDPKQVMEIRELIQQLRGSHTIILSTHILPEVEATCERIIILHQGRIVAQDSLASLAQRRSQGGQRIHLTLRKPNSEQVQKVLAGVAGVTSVSALPSGSGWTVDASGDPEVTDRLAQAVLGAGFGLVELSPTQGVLEDAFIRLTYGGEAK